MRGVLRIGGFLDVRHVPRQSGACGSSCSLSVPGFCGRRRLGDGFGGTVAGDGTRRRLGIAVSRFVMNCNVAGRVTPLQQRCAPRPAARSFWAPQRRLLAASSRIALPALQSAVVGVQPTTFLAPRPGAQARQRRSAATPCTYGAQASSLARKRTAMRSERASDDARTGNRLSTKSVGTQRRFRISANAQSSTWSGAKWCQAVTRTFFRGNVYFNPVCSAYWRSIGLGGCLTSWRDGSFRRFMSRCEDSYGCLAGPER